MSETQTAPAPSPAPAASPAPTALPLTESVIFWGKVAGGITAIGALVAAVVLGIAKLAELHALVAGIPQMSEQIAELRQDVATIKGQTQPGTLAAALRNELAAYPMAAPSTAVVAQHVPRPTALPVVTTVSAYRMGVSNLLDAAPSPADPAEPALICDAANTTPDCTEP